MQHEHILKTLFEFEVEFLPPSNHLSLPSDRIQEELVDLLNLSSWCLVMVEGLFLTVP